MIEMNPNDVDLIMSLYDSKDGYTSPYSATIDKELNSSAFNEVLAWPTSNEDRESWLYEWEEEEVDPFMYYSDRYFVFTRGTYDLMHKDLSGEVKVTFETLSAVTRVEPLNLQAHVEVHEELSFS